MYDHKPDLNKPTPIELAGRLVIGNPTDSDCKWAAGMLRDFHATLTARESELAEAQQRVAELESKLAQSTNYVADDELYPHVVWFANGRTVSIASGRHLEIGMGGRLAAAKGDVSDEP